MYEWEKMVLTDLRVFQHSQSLGKILSQSVMYLSRFNPAGNSASHNRLLNSPPPHPTVGWGRELEGWKWKTSWVEMKTIW